ncbi:MAG: type II toxin-antitoxin system VapC family toxin [Acidobacteriota bacterium]
MLVDTSIWIDHFRAHDATLAARLDQGDVECHPFIVGELACGGLRHRAEILALLQRLPEVPIAGHDEVLTFVERNRLQSSGLGWIDVHLLASVRLARTTLWTADRRLRAAARRLGVGASQPT